MMWVLFILSSMSTGAAASEDLTEMSLEELMNVEVTSVSKKTQKKTDTAAAITVITAEDIRRGGFTVIPEALRMVPGVDVGRVDAHRWSISIRGDSGLFANKLLVLIDGRSVYTPAFGGTYWDVQDYPIEDVERIEVIRGPGGTVWGANAVNGVINIITKRSKDTQGALVSAYGGSHERGLTARYGGRFGEASRTHYRFYGRAFRVDDFDLDQNGDGNDEWRQGRFGFRVDSELSDRDTLRISGDFYAEDNEEGTLVDSNTLAHRDVNYKQHGGNILLNLDRKLEAGGKLRAKAYYAADKRQFLLEESRHTVDIELQHDFVVGQDMALGRLTVDQVAVSWGTNYRLSTSHTNMDPIGIQISFDPNDEEVHLVSGFGQVQADFLDGRFSLIVGSKLGYYSWSGFEIQPSGRFIFRPKEGHAIWGAVSRAVRTPTQAERDLSLTLPAIPPSPAQIVLLGDRGARSEELLAFELGYRFFARERFNAEIALFWNEYEDRSSFRRVALPPPTVDAKFVNELELTARGVEVEVNLLPTDWWRLRMAYTYLNIDADPDPSATTISFGKIKQQNPVHQVNLQSVFELPMGFEFDTSVYFVDGLPGVRPTLEADNVEQYVRLDLRIGYRPRDWVEISLVGQNLTDRRHYEANDFTLGRSTQIPRSGYAKVTFDF